MAREVVNTFKALVDRLKAANIQGGLLDQVKLIEGPAEISIVDKDLPAIIYEILDGGVINEDCFPRGVRANMTALLTVMTHKNAGYYNDERSGILDYYEKVMTVVDGTTAIELKGDGNWGPDVPGYRIGRFDGNSFKYEYAIEIDLQSNKYTKGGL